MALSRTRKMVLHEMLVQYVKDMDAMSAADAAAKKAVSEQVSANSKHTISRNAFGMFGYSGDKMFDRLKADISEEAWSAAFQEARTPEWDESDFAGEDVPDEPVPDGMPTIRDMVLLKLKEAGEAGTKALPMRGFVENALGRELHPKTVGMTLFRLKKDGLARNEGHTWFPVEAAAETENPGVDAPGSEGAQSGREDA